MSIIDISPFYLEQTKYAYKEWDFNTQSIFVGVAFRRPQEKVHSETAEHRSLQLKFSNHAYLQFESLSTLTAHFFIFYAVKMFHVEQIVRRIKVPHIRQVFQQLKRGQPCRRIRE